MVEIFHRFADYPIQCKLGLKFGDFFHRHSPTIFILLVRDFHFIISLFKVKMIVQNCLSVTRMKIVSLMAELSTALVNLVTHEMEKIVQVKNPIRTGIKLILQSKTKTMHTSSASVIYCHLQYYSCSYRFIGKCGHKI